VHSTTPELIAGRDASQRLGAKVASPVILQLDLTFGVAASCRLNPSFFFENDIKKSCGDLG
jgi:hypothetical protein